jgi:hypothetical protein
MRKGDAKIYIGFDLNPKPYAESCMQLCIFQFGGNPKTLSAPRGDFPLFPIRDDNPTLHASVVTFLIIAINVIVWVFVQGAGFNPTFVKSLCTYGLIPGELLGTVVPGTEVTLGGGLAFVIEDSHNWFSLISHMFMHGGWPKAALRSPTISRCPACSTLPC